MNITATRIATELRTWLLIAAITGLLIAVGGAIGGGALYLFVALAVGMNVVGYWFSDRIALAASRARPVRPGSSRSLRRWSTSSPAAPRCRCGGCLCPGTEWRVCADEAVRTHAIRLRFAPRRGPVGVDGGEE